jgi:hypothetical protein
MNRSNCPNGRFGHQYVDPWVQPEAAAQQMADGDPIRAGNLQTQALDAQPMRTSLHVQQLLR